VVYDGGKLRSSIVSVPISFISGMRVIEPQIIILLLGVGLSSSLLSGSFCVALVLHYFLVKHNHCHGKTE
jgi:threonine/homoserine efflux transporter RhtA